MTTAFPNGPRPRADGWVAAIHQTERDRQPLGSGFLIDAYRVLTCAHVVISNRAPRDELWVVFPKALELMQHRFKVRQVITPALDAQDEQDVAVLVLEQAVSEEFAAQLRRPNPRDLAGSQWWSFGFADGAWGSSATGAIGEEIGYGWVHLDTESKSHVRPGFSGAALWSADYQAVVGLVGQAQGSSGHARALTMRAVDLFLPDEKLHLLTDWSVEAAGDAALSAWGWTLADDPESGRHWRPRARGVSTDAERGFRFRGRTAALSAIVAWITGRTGDRRQVLLVTGSPGVGKSAVLGRIVTTADRGIAETLPPEDDAVRAPEGSVACAVHARGKTALEVAQEIAAAASAPLPDHADDLPLMLRSVLRERPQRGFAVVIDALDEAVTPEQARTIMRSIAIPLAETCVDLGVRVVVGSRRMDDAGDLLVPFRNAIEPVDLDSPEFFAQEDLAAYTQATLQLLGDERPDSPYGEQAAAIAVAERIALLAQGNFLVAGLVARSHGMHDRRAIDPAHVSFTPTVDAALRDYLALLPTVDGIPAVDVLTVLAYAESPGLTIDLWLTAVQAVTGRAPNASGLLAFARSSAANFLIESSDASTPSSAFRLFHQALNESLLRPRAAAGATESDECVITRAFKCLGRTDHWKGAPSYLLSSLPRHAVRGGVINDLLGEDSYPLYADLRRLIPAAKAASSATALARGRLLRKTPQALDAAPADRVALFSVTEAREHLGNTYRKVTLHAPYRAVWAVGSTHAEEIVLEGHTDWVNTLCSVSVGGQVLLATASSDTKVRVWDPETGDLLRVLEGHTGAVLALCSVPVGDRTFLVSGGNDNTVRLWDPETGKPLHVLEGHTGAVRATHAVPVGDRTLLVSGGNDNTVRLWDPETGKPLRVLEGHTKWVNTVSAVPVGDRTLLATASSDTTVRMWDPETGDLLRVLEGHTEWVNTVCSVPVGDRTLLVSGGNDNTVRLWDPETGKPLRVLEGHTKWVNTVSAVPVGDRTLLATAGDDRTVRLWDPATGDTPGALEGHIGAVLALCAVSVGGRSLLATAGDDNTVRLWDPGTGDAPGTLEGHIGAVAALCTVPVGDRSLLATAGGDDTVRLWDPKTGHVLRTLEGHNDWIRAACVLPVGGRSLLATAGDDDTVRLWNPETGVMLRVLGHAGGVNTVCAVPVGGRNLLAAGDDRTVRLWDPETGDMLRTIERTKWVNTVCSVVAGDRNLLATAGGDELVRLWDPDTGGMVRTFEGHTSRVNAVCAVPLGDRTLFATGGDDRTVRLWDPGTGDALHIFDGHTGPVRAACAITSGDRTLLATAGDDRTVRFWDPRTPYSVMAIPVHSRALSIAEAEGLVVIGLDDGILALSITQPTPPSTRTPPSGEAHAATRWRAPWLQQEAEVRRDED
ncbi:trypsin-like peptidase domain-containing protein [Kitasatospora aureofaciens]|uniref:trypsin-like peptidase domain-containing protein n=1 Tax=Kitasatospora aureofaciens TaxID=1894 RepID=UPI0033C72DC2